MIPRAICRFTVISVAVASLSACTQGASIVNSSVQRSVPVETAYALPPPGGPEVIHVIQRSYSNGLEQNISLATDSAVPGQNFFRIRVIGSLDPKEAGDGSAPSSQLSLTRSIGSELRTEFRRMAMTRSPYFVQNRYGPFSYAVGRSGSDTCLYGWQNLRSKPSLIGNKGVVDVRLRLCQENATERGLLSVMYGYTLNAYLNDKNWNPYGDPPAVPDTLGAAGPEVYPLGQSRYETVLPEPAPKAKPRRIIKRRVAEDLPPVAEEEPVGPTVPPPPSVADTTVVPPPAAE